MNSALVIVNVVERDGQEFEKQLLINNNNVRNFHAHPVDTNYTVVTYDLRRDRREDPQHTTYKVAHTVAEFEWLLREEANEPVIPLYVNTRGHKFRMKNIVNRVEYINVDSFVLAYDNADGLSAKVWVDEGAFNILVLDVAHTINEINRRESTSYSYSESGI